MQFCPRWVPTGLTTEFSSQLLSLPLLVPFALSTRRRPYSSSPMPSTLCASFQQHAPLLSVLGCPGSPPTGLLPGDESQVLPSGTLELAGPRTLLVRPL